MTQQPIPEVAEEEATGQTAEIYADIRSQLGVPVVNLIFRRLAADAHGLAWAWGSVRPAIVSGASTTAAHRLVEGRSGRHLRSVPEETLRVLGVDLDARRQIDRIIATYERANALNLVNLTCLSLLLERTEPVGSPASARTASDTTRSSDAADEPLPAMVALDAMDPDLRALVDRLSLRAGGSNTLTPSLYRHLAHWPTFLAVGYLALVPLLEDDTLGRASEDLAAIARQQAGAIVDDHLAGQAAPASSQLRRTVSSCLEPFHATIPTMLSVATLLGELIRDDA